MEKRTFWPFSVKNFPQDMNIPVEKCEVDPNIMKAIYEYRFYGKPKEDPIPHLKKFNERCKMLNLSHANIKIKLFPYSLGGKALDWILRWPPGNFSTWFNLKAAFIERFCSTEKVCNLRQIIITFKQEEDEPLVKTWERFRGIAFGMEHGLRDWMLMHVFYRGLSETSRVFLDNECEGSFMNTAATDTHNLLDGLLLEVRIKESLEKAQVPEDVFDDRHEIFNLHNRGR